MHEGRKVLTGIVLFGGGYGYLTKDYFTGFSIAIGTPVAAVTLFFVVYVLSEVANRLLFGTHKNADGSINWRDHNK